MNMDKRHATFLILLAPLFKRWIALAIHCISHYPADSVNGFPNTYPLDRDLYGG